MKLYQNPILHAIYFYVQLLCGFVITNILLIAYMIVLSMASGYQISLSLLFLVTWPIGPYVVTFFQMMSLREPKEHHTPSQVTLGLFLKNYFSNLTSNIAWFLVMHLAIFILLVDLVFLPNPIRLVFLFLLFMALSIAMLASYLLSKKKLRLKETFQLTIALLYSKLFKTLSYMFFYLFLLTVAWWYSGIFLSLFVFFLFLTLVYMYFEKNF